VRLATLTHPTLPDTAAVRIGEGFVPLTTLGDAVGRSWPSSLEGVLDGGHLPEIATALGHAAVPALPHAAAPWRPGPPLRHPRKLLGVGLNYAEHAGDLGEKRPDEPATFMKPATTIIGAGDTIAIPTQSERTTGEGELGLVIGRRCRDLSVSEALSAVAGALLVIDMTAEDVLQRNPRFLTRAKSFDTFLALGPELVTLDELPPLDDLEVRTLHRGGIGRRNVVANMMFSPAALVAFFSQVMTLEPGDVISTGTPGAVVLAHGDTVGCAIPGLGEFHCPVIDRKTAP
jgi:2-keto-4-pentenoate hydratase/2-oxohepta-3-ene-1,7-dioic acid hydratase in catechol pathway